MKPRNFVVNIILTLLSIFLTISVCFGTQIHWAILFIGIGVILTLVPEWILKPKHKATYLVYKGVAQLILLILMFMTLFFGFIYTLIFDVQNSLHQSCNSTISHSELDEFLASYLMLYAIPIFVRIVMNIIDFATYKKERKKGN